eukprot:TRINITY_DN34386_c0_g1_i1.p1 TRINITY_DN34386_c0_g1~~TRINITY_DN34386_c0_g1_i1.p1  ORF type:complete len:375 (+),score=57.67 TRINITY_DN34386_c0_g1_i1:65-1189(+)
MVVYIEAPCGRVEISEKAVGQGASGSVYLGTCAALGPEREEIAVKVVQGVSNNTRATSAWRRELRVVRPLISLPHRNVLAYYAAFRYDGEAITSTRKSWDTTNMISPGDGIVIMERGRPSPLPVGVRPESDGVWKAERRWRVQQARWAAEVLISAANALHWLHHVVRAIHRDLKLDNLLLSSSGCVKLADFSAAKVQLYGLQLAATRAGIGTTGSMAPELYFRGMNYSAVVDMWSLGCAVVEAFNGSTPYNIEAFLAVVAQGQLKPSSSSSNVNAIFSSELQAENAHAAKLKLAVESLKGNIRQRLTEWLPEDCSICGPLSAVLIRLLVPEPDLRLTSAARQAGWLRSGPVSCIRQLGPLRRADCCGSPARAAC